MTAPHSVTLVARRCPAELVPWLLAQDELDVRAVQTRLACIAAELSPALTAALVARAASPAVVLAAARLPLEIPALAGELVADCIDAERAGLLERPCADPRAGGLS